MDENTITQIKEYYNDLPQEVKDAILASDLPDKLKGIANKYNLKIDELGILRNEVMVVMLGIEPSSKFQENLVEDLGINRKTASEIANDVHDQVFKPIKEFLIAWEEDSTTKNQPEGQPSHLPETESPSPLERAGGFSLERDVENGEGNADNGSLYPSENRDNLLKGIENPSSKNLVGVPNYSLNTNVRKEPIADHLLKQGSGQEAQQFQPTPQQNRSTPPPYSGSDPYREPTN